MVKPQVGFEPTKMSFADSRLKPLGPLRRKPLVGIEPTTSFLPRMRSTTEL